jgi:septal ring factor EnvC (AmiA/AmiB activator)
MTEEQLAAAYNQLDLLVQPEGDAALEALMAYIRELQQELAEAYADLNHYHRHVYQGEPLAELERLRSVVGDAMSTPWIVRGYNRDTRE